MKMISQGQSKFLPSHTSAQLKETKEDMHPAAFSLPTRQGFAQNIYADPEEEIFSISLESPGKRPSLSYGWQFDVQDSRFGLFTSAILKTGSSSTMAASALELESGHEQVLQVTPKGTPCQHLSNPVAPPRHKKVGR